VYFVMSNQQHSQLQNIVHIVRVIIDSPT
jgi:hypothetical protein